MKVLTVGHSTLSLEEFSALLKVHGVGRLVDVRTVPRSRTNPQFNLESLPAGLGAEGIGHTHLAGLGGLRSRRKDLSASPNTGWRNDSFRNYADYALTPAFASALGDLLRLAEQEQVAIMCAESLWWRCHRRIVADYLLARGVDVFHIMGAGAPAPHQLTAFAAARPDGTIVYQGTGARGQGAGAGDEDVGSRE